ncbi:hypothetical protein ABZY31_02485 [Streptomyces sp. NPDC006529]|uniref:hypothetical protein n=1 Tax=Streptomyces sp. NPDC006529 TaxID=3157177 RepID=UPI0033A7E2C7
MPPAAPGTPRWDSQAQRWIWDSAPAAPGSAAPPAAPPTVPAQPPVPPAQPAAAPTQPAAAPPAVPLYGPPPGGPVYGPPDPGAWPPAGPDRQLPVQAQPLYPPAPPLYPGPDGRGPDGPPRRWLTPATAGIAVAAVAIGAAVVWFVLRDSGGAAPDQAHGTGTPSVSASASPDPTGSASDGPSAVASASAGPSASASASASSAGHVTLEDPKGFTVAVPRGWTRDDPGNGVFYRSADRSSLLQVFRVVEPELSPLDAVKGASADLRNRTSGYTEVKVGAVPGGSGACELVYEYDSAESHGRRRGVERVFFAQDGNKWALLAAGPAGEWETTQDHLTAAVGAFRP